jgi:hypothetical protein
MMARRCVDHDVASVLVTAVNQVAVAVWQSERRGRIVRGHKQETIYVCVIGFNLPRRVVARALGVHHRWINVACFTIEDRREDNPACDARVRQIGRLLGLDL